jgi:hypothetical protein
MGNQIFVPLLLFLPLIRIFKGASHIETQKQKGLRFCSECWRWAGIWVGFCRLRQEGLRRRGEGGKQGSRQGSPRLGL